MSPDISSQAVGFNGSCKTVSEDIIRLLVNIYRHGSINRAAKAMSMRYSKAWNLVKRIDNVISVGYVKKGGRGGGGVILSENALEFLRKMLSQSHRIYAGEFRTIYPEAKNVFLYYRGSHDIAFNHLIKALEESKTLVYAEWVGSLAGIASLTLGESDFAGVHILNNNLVPSNIETLKMFGLENKVVVVKGYERLQGFLLKSSTMNIEDILKNVVEGGQVIALRPPATGTRLLFNILLRKYLGKHGRGEESASLKTLEMKTHNDVAKAISENRADVGIGIGCLSKIYNLKFLPIAWESFDFVFSLENTDLDVVKKFAGILKDKEFISTIESLEGYRAPKNIGEIIKL